MKAYTGIGQSKKLAEILPLESADMGWNVFVDGTTDLFCEQDLYELVEQKPTDNVEPKFKVGDWITFYGDEPFKILKIEAEQNGILDYLLLDQNGHDSYYNKKYVDENARLWTIKDAKDGDILK
jgi:hypothetical protein